MKQQKSTMRADAQRNYDQLIAAAHAAFSTKGALAPLDFIAKKAGVGIGTLYRHFPTRLELLLAVYAEKVDELINEVARVAENVTPEKALARWFEDIIRFSDKYRGFGELLSNAAKDEKSPIAAMSARLLKEAQEKGQIRKDVNAVDVLQLLHGITARDTLSEAEASKLLDIILDGLKAKS